MSAPLEVSHTCSAERPVLSLCAQNKIQILWQRHQVPLKPLLPSPSPADHQRSGVWRPRCSLLSPALASLPNLPPSIMSQPGSASSQKPAQAPPVLLQPQHPHNQYCLAGGGALLRLTPAFLMPVSNAPRLDRPPS